MKTRRQTPPAQPDPHPATGRDSRHLVAAGEIFDPSWTPAISQAMAHAARPEVRRRAMKNAADDEPGWLIRRAIDAAPERIVIEEGKILGPDGAVSTLVRLHERLRAAQRARAVPLAPPLALLVERSREELDLAIHFGPQGAANAWGLSDPMAQLHVQAFRSMTSLGLNGLRLDDQDVATMMPALSAARALRVLDLSANSLSGDSATALGRALPAWPELLRLALHHNCLEDKHVERFAAHLGNPASPKRPVKRLIDLGNTAWMEDKWAALSASLAERVGDADALAAARCDLSQVLVGIEVNFARECGAELRLRLARARGPDTVLLALTRGASLLPRLTMLELDGRDLGNSGEYFFRIMVGLADRCGALRHLSLRHNALGDTEFRQVGYTLPYLHGLLTLDMRHNAAGPAACADLRIEAKKIFSLLALFLDDGQTYGCRAGCSCLALCAYEKVSPHAEAFAAEMAHLDAVFAARDARAQSVSPAGPISTS